MDTKIVLKVLFTIGFQSFNLKIYIIILNLLIV